MQLPSVFTARPPFKGCKAQENPEFTNILKQNFNVTAPNKAWVSDITYVKVNGKFRYICVIIDLFARKVIAYRCGNTATKELAIETFSLALKNRNFPKNVIFHSDRGCQYTSKAFRKTIDSAGFIQSFSKPGYPYDNAVAESFFKYFKLGELNRRSYRTLKELELSTFEYIEKYYNAYNPHSHNGGLSPNKAEQSFFNFSSTNMLASILVDENNNPLLPISIQ